MSIIHTIKKISFNWLINSIPFSRRQQIINQLLKRGKLIKIDFQKTLINAGCHQFIIIGANDGLSFDSNFNYFIENFNHGTLVEPHPYYFNLLEKNILELKRSNKITLINKAISDEPFLLFAVKSESLEKYPQWVRGSSSFSQNHLLKLGVDSNDIERIDVLNIPINELLSQFKHVNYLQIDTEGYDYFILKDIDFSKTTFDFIKFEKINLEKNQLSHLYEILKSERFLLIEDGIDTYAISEKIKIQFL